MQLDANFVDKMEMNSFLAGLKAMHVPSTGQRCAWPATKVPGELDIPKL